MSGRRTSLSEAGSMKVGTHVPPDERTSQPDIDNPTSNTSSETGEALALWVKDPEQRTPEKAQQIAQRTLPSDKFRFIEEPLPDETADVNTIIRKCEQRIYAALEIHKQLAEAADATFYALAAPAVYLVHVTEGWRKIPNPRAAKQGELYRSFSEWLRVNGVTRSHAYKMIDSVPVEEALAPIERVRLSPTQVRILAPILRSYGADALREIWTTCSVNSTGDRTSTALIIARDRAGFIHGNTIELGRERSTEERTPALRIVAGKVDTDQVREFARTDPTALRAWANAALDVLNEIKAEAQLQNPDTSVSSEDTPG